MQGDKKYWVGFNLTPGVGPVKIRRLLDTFGDLETAWKAPIPHLRSAGLGPKVLQDFRTFRSRVNLNNEWAKIESIGVDVVTWLDDEYPERLKEIDYAPPILYVRGDTTAAEAASVAVVGTRQPSPYGEAITREICGLLVHHHVTVVSGLARGIDGIAHKAVVEAGGTTISVLGSGVDQIYPPEHRKLAQGIVQNGAVMSDYPLGTRPEPRNFPPRNRIISGLSLIVVVVEAGQSSGALITPNFAVEQGRDVMAVPGDIRSSASQGANRLIKEGAAPVTEPEDVLDALEIEISIRGRKHPRPPGLSATEESVFKAIRGRPVHVDEICATENLDISSVSSALSKLELLGIAAEDGNKWFVKFE